MIVTDTHQDAPAADFPIIGIGGSAGGLEAFEQFLKAVPASSGAAFVIIQHLDPTREGVVPEILRRSTPMPVLEAQDRMVVLADHVYVIPPNKDMALEQGTLRLFAPAERRGMRLPINFFFAALTRERQRRAIGVVLSGMGSDGTQGLKLIREAGGLTLAQEPRTARFDSMPRSAIDGGAVDIVASASELPGRILTYLLHLPVSAKNAAVSEDLVHSALERVLIQLRNRTGHDFSQYKKSTVYRRIERRMAIHHIDGINTYVALMRDNPQEIDLLFKELLIGVTHFFRDPAVWEYMTEDVIPQLLNAHPEGRALRAWTPGCSTGEEAYSLAIAFRECIERIKPVGNYSLQIFATDLDPESIEHARQGYYPSSIAADLPPERLARFFIADGNGYRVIKEIREMVIFAVQNIIMDPPFTKLDLLTCRNLMIYFTGELQEKLIPLFHYSLVANGVLLLGSAETIGRYSELFSPTHHKFRVFKRLETTTRSSAIEFPTRMQPTPDNSDELRQPALAPNLQSLAEQVVLKHFTPAAVLVNDHGDIVFISGRTGKYLEPAAGKADWNIHSMAREGLDRALRRAMGEAIASGKPVTADDVTVDTDAGNQLITLVVRPLDEPLPLRGMLMVAFFDERARLDNPPRKKRRGSAPQAVESDEIERITARARAEVRAIRDEMQISQEELKSANEELQSTNEELQSTNEELTTSKEEMQSLNEELQTVNAELQSKVDDLSRANDDMNNLLNSTDIATVFLDNAMNVRRFTSAATRIIKLIPGDVGRPLSDIASELEYGDLQEDAREVLRTLVFSEKQVPARNERWFSVRIMPYRTLENVIDGVVITFADITKTKRLEEELRRLLAQGSADAAQNHGA
ncbi:PAS domain-containing protein [Rhodocyclus tenuis]|uniref:chemotaxis protein CheB n=1 Tax=Rhodocyclus gracilis TaxID=2929842 RepID=UPI001298C529|nr:chemotaxis protein CheB [Rhodocyclus gracilis]MRD72902.1 PAS domain-containing protein [Rhodocyclus gracilis]